MAILDQQHISNSDVCHVSRKTNQVLTTLCEKVPKTLKKPQNATKHVISSI